MQEIVDNYLSAPDYRIFLSVLFVIIATVAYTIKELYSHGKLTWLYDADQHDFWGDRSYVRKYQQPITPAPNNWYYRFFEIRYKELFPGSATIFVSLTDGYHLCQFIFTTTACAAIAIPFAYPIVAFTLLRVSFWITFSLIYKKYGI